MTRTNFELLDRSMRQLARILRPFVERVLKRRYQDKWEEPIYRVVRAARRSTGAGDALKDPFVLLKLIAQQWLDFADEQEFASNPECRNYAFELVTIRNRWAHNEDINDSDTFRALDSIERMISAVASGEANAELQDMMRQVRQKLDDKMPVDGVEGSEVLDDCPTRWDSLAYREDKCRAYTARTWIDEQVDAWTVHDGERALLICGDPGSGKSAFLADFVARNPDNSILAFHFCIASTPETLRAACFVQSIAAMLWCKGGVFADCIPDDDVLRKISRTKCESDPASTFEAGIITPLHRMKQPEGALRYIIVDALDEALLCQNGGISIVELLATRIDRFPSWIRLIATSRRDSDVLRQFSGVRTIAIDGKDVHGNSDSESAQRIRLDLHTYIASRLEQPNFLERIQQYRRSITDITSDLIRKSELSFLYARLALDGVERDAYTFDQMDALPPGLDAFMQFAFSRQFPVPAKYERCRDILEVILAAMEPIDDKFIAAATKIDCDYDILPLMHQLHHFVHAVGDVGACRYAVIHDYVRKWLADKKRAGIFYVNVKRGHERVADVLMNEYTNKHSEVSEYLLHHWISHLAELGRLHEIVQLLTDLQFAEAKSLPKYLDELIRDYDRFSAEASFNERDRQILKELGACLSLARGTHAIDERCSLFQVVWNYCVARHDCTLHEIVSRWRTEFENRTPPRPWIRLIQKYPIDDPVIVAKFSRAPFVLESEIYNVVVSPSTEVIAILSDAGELCVLSKSSEIIYDSDEEDDYKTWRMLLAIDNSDRYLLVVDDDQLVVISLFAKHDTQEVLGRYPIGEEVPACAIGCRHAGYFEAILTNGLRVTWSKETGFREEQLCWDVPLIAAEISVDGQWLAVSSANRFIGEIGGAAIDFDVPSISVTPRHICLQPQTGWAAFLPDVESLASEENTIIPFVTIWNPSLGNDTVSLEVGADDSDAGVCMAFAHSEPWLAIGKEDGSITVFDVNKNERVWSCQEYSGKVTSLRWSSDDTRLFASRERYREREPEVIVYRINHRGNSRQPHELWIHGYICTVNSNRDGSLFAGGDEYGSLAIWNGDASLRQLPLHFRMEIDEVITRKGDQILEKVSKILPAGFGKNFPIVVDHDVKERMKGADSEDLDGPAASRVLFPLHNREHVILVLVDGTIQIWDSKTGYPIRSLAIDGESVELQGCWAGLSGDGNVLVGMTGSGTIAAWSLPDEYRLVTRIQSADESGQDKRPSTNHAAISLSWDGELLATIMRDPPVERTEATFRDPIMDIINSPVVYEIKIVRLISGQVCQKWTTSIDRFSNHVQSRVVDDFMSNQFLVVGFLHAVFDTGCWIVRIWDIHDGTKTFDGEVEGLNGEFDHVLIRACERGGIRLRECDCTPGWRYNSGELICVGDAGHVIRRVSIFSNGAHDSKVYYSPALDGAAGGYNRKVFLGFKGKELHFLKIENVTD